MFGVLVCVCVFFLRDSTMCVGGSEGERRERDRGRMNLKQTPCLARSLTQGSIPLLWDHDLSWNQESDAQPTEPPSHALKILFLSHLYTQCGDQTHNFKIKSCALHQLSRPGALAGTGFPSRIQWRNHRCIWCPALSTPFAWNGSPASPCLWCHEHCLESRKCCL